jgi:PKD repeat protein
MRYFGSLIFLALALSLTAHASTPITPKTTLAAETGNNTSTANTFVAQTNGNSGAVNVSKVPIRTLLYGGAKTKIYAHWMPWFGTSSHMNVGYDSSNPVQVSLQVADMASRGIDGAIVDWYGPNNTQHNTATINLMTSSQAMGGKFSFAITEDVGALKSCANTSGCDVTAQAISDLTYAYNTFEGSPAYMRVNGRPVVFFFGTEAYALDWTRIRANTPGNPMFIFRNSSAFSKAESNGGFSWIGLSSDPTNMGLGYLDNFYNTALNYASSATFGSGYKGFNDTLSSWGSNRILNQQCGQTWLATFAEAGRYYSTTNQLASLQIVTWNDYEEGSEIETGIDNCVTVSGSTAGNSVNWSITGQENTVDHYTVFISLDGQNLMPVADVAAGTHTLDLGQYSFDPANYTLYVKAVGKPTLTNKMSGPITWTLANLAPVAKLSVTPTSGIAPTTVNADASTSSAVNGTIASIAIDFGDGTVQNGPAAAHNYSSPGTYAVTATVTDSFGGIARASSTVTLVANQPPLARLTITPFSGIAPVTVSADASASSDPDGKVSSTSINFGDGTVVKAATATHTYSTPGNYIVTATVTDDRGANSTATATATITSNQLPVARLSVTPTSGVAPVTVTADASASTDADGRIASVVINFGDGTLSTAVTASHKYSKAGSYTVTATVTDDRGAGSATAKIVTVSAPTNKPPVVSVTALPTSVTAGSPVFAQVKASDSDGKIAAISINWGDGTTLSGTSAASHVFTKAGVYKITATATDNLGAKTSATTSVTVSWGVVVTAPVPGGTYGSPVRVVAKASSSAQITCIKIYLDNVAVYSINNVSQIDTYVKMATGSRRLVVQAWDANGVVYKNVQYITVK